MPKLQDNYVLVAGGVIIWDGLNNPDTKDGKDGAYTIYNLSVGLPNTSPDKPLLDGICQEEFQTGYWKGKWPTNGFWPIKNIDPAKFEGFLPTHFEIKAITYNMPEVYDANNNRLDPMQFKGMLYPGCAVDIIVSPRSYDNVSKGIGFWLNGVRIMDTTRPRLPGIGGIDAGRAFGAPTGAGPAGPGPAMGGPAVGGPTPPVGPGPMPPGVKPAPEFLNGPPAALGGPPAGPVYAMTPLAKGTREAYLAAGVGWTDELLIQHGLMIKDGVPF
jgi:hypothetical protein